MTRPSAGRNEKDRCSSEMVGRLGLEPRTHGLKVRCSTIELTPRGADRTVLRHRTKRTDSGGRLAAPTAIQARSRDPQREPPSTRGVTSRPVQNAFFEPLGPGAFLATGATAGPWSEDAQHGGPPSALATRELEQHEADGTQRLARVTVDILRPVPLGELTLTTRTVRAGRRVALFETMMQAQGQDVLHARGWRIALSSAGLPEHARPPEPQLPPIPDEHPLPVFPGGYMDGYLAAIEWRFVTGGFDTAARAAAWTRPRIPLVAGEEPSPACRTMLVADSGSGVSSVLDPMHFLFINVELSVALHRDPVGEWILLDAVTNVGDTGTGVAQTALSDASGSFGVGLQTLLITPR